MVRRENAFVEAMKFLKDRNNSLVEAKEKKLNERLNEHNEFMNNYYNIKDNRKRVEDLKSKILESCKDDALATAIKAIYITALEAETLTDSGLILAEEMVDKWIKTEGGAAKIIRENKNKTYLLNRICTIVEEVALEDMRSIMEADEDPDDITKEDEELDYELDEDDKENLEKSEKSEEGNEEEVIDDPETGDEVEVEDNNDEITTDSNGDVSYGVEGEKDNADQVDSDDEHDEPEVKDEVDEEIDDLAADNDPEETDDDIDNDNETDIEPEPEDYDNKILDDLDKEEDVQKAVALIRQRVADAEETFIKNNAKDKEQINALLGKISDNIKTVEDMGEKDLEKGKDAVAQEAVKLSRQKIDQITNNRPLSIMEMVARSLNKDIIRDEALREEYLEEDGSLDIDTIVESSKVIYGFLETLNTIQLGRKIDQDYLKEIFG